MYKSIVSNGVYLSLDNNKRIVATSTTNQFKFQICDDQGTFASDDWILHVPPFLHGLIEQADEEQVDP